MAPDPLGSLLVLILLFLAGALLRLAEAASQRIDEDRFERGDEELLRRALPLVKSAQHRFGDPDSAFGFLMLGALALALAWLLDPLEGWLSGFIRPSVLAKALAASGIAIPTGALYTALAGLLPNFLASHAPERALRLSAGPARLVLTMLRPLTGLSKALAALCLRVLHVHPAAAAERVTEQEILAMVDIGEEKGEIEPDEKQMIENIFEFSNMTAEDCMIHRKDFTCLDVEEEPSEILKIIRESGLSRFPVYEEDVDNIIGILTTRDYLLNGCSEGGKSIRELIRPAYFVPETLRADVLFSEMQKRKQHMAIVVDEYGGTSGLVTMEDLLEEIVGNIYDEFDPQAHEDVIPLGENRWRVNGSTDLDALGEAVGVDLSSDDEADTLGGLVFSNLTEIPSDGERPVVTHRGLRISVEEILDRRVEWAIVEKLPPDGDFKKDAHLATAQAK
ncbi:MAG: HlyC/CorC family transporter [Clostridiales bacterium]|nr:HlyC/CorC family transporter [Clostridiales bacterium]